ncbi:metal ABC transporter substrate-binding protein [Pollutimonas harenae]|nr:metal ABC transporter substrate-binding protein [Pollutimonas harenae]
MYSALASFHMGRRLVLGSMLSGLLIASVPVAQAAQALAPAKPVKVVATFSILGDMVKEIGGEYVELTTIVGPNSDAHTFEPTPADVKALADAQVLVLNGLDFEAWLPRLIQSAGFQGQQLLASQGVSVLHLNPAEQAHDDHGKHAEAPKEADAADDHDHPQHTSDVDPHAWQSLQNGIIYAQNIREGLIKAAPAHRAYFKGRASVFIEQMKKLDAEIKLAFSEIPKNKRKVISSHDAFGYFAQAYGVHFVPLAGLSSQAEPSAKEMAAVIDTIKQEGISGVFAENMTSSRLASQIARETGAVVGGTLYSDALDVPGQPAASYLGLITWNAGQLIYVLKGGLTKG